MKQKKRGADWVHTKTRSLVSVGNGCPEEIVNRIFSMIKNRDNILTVEREATEAQIEALEASQDRIIQRSHMVKE